MNKYDVLIVGGGPVGLYGLFLSNYMKLKTILVESDKELGGFPKKFFPTKTIPNFPYLNTNKEFITGDELISNLIELSNKQNAEILTNAQILDIEPKKDDYFCVKIDNGQEIYAKYILMTIGKCVCKFKEISPDLICLKSKIDIHYKPHKIENYNDKDVVVLGGGDGAIDYSIMIAEKSNSKSVTLIHHRESLNSKSSTIQDLEKSNISCFLNHKIENINDQYIIIKNNSDETIKNISFDSILVQYGTELINVPYILNKFETRENKFVVDNNYQTSINDIYAAGSCIYKSNRINMIIMGISEVTLVLNHIKHLLPDTEQVIW